MTRAHAVSGTSTLFVAGAALVVWLFLAVGSTPSAAAPAVFDCTFNGPRYPALTQTSRPGRLYVVWIRRQLTCDEARSVARRGSGTVNPGKFRSFEVSGGWTCMSLAPDVGNGKVLAGQCARPDRGELVNWLPMCEPRKPCKKLKRES